MKDLIFTILLIIFLWLAVQMAERGVNLFVVLGQALLMGFGIWALIVVLRFVDNKLRRQHKNMA